MNPAPSTDPRDRRTGAGLARTITERSPMNIRSARCAIVVAALGFATIGFALPSAASPHRLAPTAASPARPTTPAMGHLQVLATADDQAEFGSTAAAPWQPNFQLSGAVRPRWGDSAGATLLASPLGSPTRQETQVITGEIYDGVIPLSPIWSFKKNNNFGHVALSEDTLVALAKVEKVNPLYPDPENGPQNGPGAIHFFEKHDGRWQRVQKLEFPAEVVGTTAAFGNILAISGDTLFISAQRGNVAASRPGKVYVYRRIDGTWQQTQILTDGVIQNHAYSFGAFIALQGDRALIADVAENGRRGAVYAFSKTDDGTWMQTQRLTLADAPEYAFFGTGLGLDGSTAMIAASFATPPDDSNPPTADPVVYVHELDASSGEWSSSQSLRSCGVTAEGYAYDFGYRRMELAGDTAAIADVSGSLTSPDPVEGTGIVCVFTRSNGVWANSQTLTEDDPAIGNLFGFSFALKGDLLAIGSLKSFGDDPYVADGIAYVFGRSGADWSLSDKVVRGGPAYLNDDSDGSAVVVGIDGNAVVSASGIDAGVDYSGIHVFDFPAQATATPESLRLSLAPGAQTSLPLRIGNAGAGTALSFSLTDGSTLTQMSEEAPVPSMGIGMPQCRLSGEPGGFQECVEVIGTSATSWYRRFYFGEYPHVGASATIDAVTVGIEGSQAGIPVTVKLYTKPHDDGAVDTLDSFQLEYIGGGTAVTDGTPHSLLRVPMDGTVTVQDTAFEDLVVEYHVDEHPGLPAFVPGANASPQTHSTFITSFRGEYLYAGQTSHILISPHLDPAASGIRCATPENTPWLRVAAPTEGRVAAGSSQDLAVTIDASDLAPGQYSTELCVATKGPLPSMMRVPVELTVSEAGDAIFDDGFDGTQP